MSHILWQSRSELLHTSFQEGRLDKRANGGNAYDFHAIQALGRNHHIELDKTAVRQSDEHILLYWCRQFGHRAVADLVVKDPALVVFGKIGVAPLEVAMVHHLDYDLQRSSLKHRWFFRQLFRRLKRLDAVVTVSSYWKKELRRLGCKNVKVIYNAFDLQEFEFERNETHEFLSRYGIPQDRPLVYIGNTGERKGGEEVYQTLKDAGYTLVMTGGKKMDLPVYSFNLSRRDYLCLLKACDVVISMSSMLEGWNRVAHEAMLCGTPVIGSGTGGMKELLQGGGQLVLKEVGGLRDAVEGVLSRRKEAGRRGYHYVKQFDSDYFARSWNEFVQLLLDGKSDIPRASMPALQ